MPEFHFFFVFFGGGEAEKTQTARESDFLQIKSEQK